MLALSLDPAMRGWMNEGKSYIPPVGIGEVMRAGGIGDVVASKNPAFAVGDTVSGTLGVQEYALVPSRPDRAAACSKIDLRVGTPTQWLNVLGMPGMTALLRPDGRRPAEGGRDGRRLGRGRRGRPDRRPAREDQGLPRGRHRRRPGEVRLGRQRARLRRLHRLQGRPGEGRAARSTARRASTSTSTTSAARSSTRC